MQSLNVGVFQPYKHWHDVIIQNAVAEFNVEYSMNRFCQNLVKIRNNIFKKFIIRFVFAKSDVWPLNENRCIDQFRKFFRTKNLEVKIKSKNGISLAFFSSTLPLPRSRVQPNTLEDVERGLIEWLSKIQNHTQWNDSIRKEKLNDFVNFTQKIVAKANFKDYELFFHHKRRHDELIQKVTCRKRLRTTFFIDKGLGFIKKNAMRMLINKQRKKIEAEKKKKHNQFMRNWRMKKNNVHAKNIIVRKTKKIASNESKISRNEKFIYLSMIWSRSKISKLFEKQLMWFE